MPKLTKRIVEATPIDESRDITLWDSSIPGFGVRVWPSGKRTYILKYRNNDGRQRKLTIGRHGPLTVERARTQAMRLLGEAKVGVDPATSKLSARRAPSIRDLSERYLAEHARTKKRPSSVRSDESLLRLHILPRLANTKVGSVDRADIARIHHEMRKTPGAANRTLALLSKMFSLAEKWGLRPNGSNPCRHVEKYKERKLERFLSADELARLGDVLNDAEQTGIEMPSAIAAIRLLLLTGCRLSEILELRWSYVDFERQCLRLPESKTGAKVVYLAPPVLEILDNIEHVEGNPFVIVGGRPGAHLVNLRKPWYRIRCTAGLDDVRLHDLRHSFASVAVSGGVSLPVLGALLGHTQAATTQRYAHLAADPIRQAVSATAGSIAAAIRLSAGADE